MRGADKIHFPALCLSRDASIVPVADAEALSRCSALALFGNRYFEGLQIFDAANDLHVVKAASPKKALSGLGLWWARVTNRKLEVELELEHPTPKSMQEVKAAVIAWLRKRPAFWEASRDLSEWENAVMQAHGVPELAALFR